MSENNLFSGYLKELCAVARQGDAREESFYPALAGFLQAFADAAGHKHVRVTTLPKTTDAGNPDFRLWNGMNRIVGYVEAKKPSEERLDVIEESEQLKRYLATFPNLILTNFCEFRLYRDGELIQSVMAARPFALTSLRTATATEKAGELHGLLERFLDFSLPKAFTAESLAAELAKRTRFLRDVVGRQLVQEKDRPGVLAGFFEAFQTYLIGTLTTADFADLFAQTIAYGLFAARTRAEDGEKFSRISAFNSIPHTIGVLRDLFRFISLGDLPDQLAWCVDDLAEVLAVADAHGILDRYYREGKGSDPIVHFYETFLAHYDPAERERRGVYYTPEPVVGYIVRSLHGILKADFGKRDGLASEGVTLLDPAAGTMTFVARAAALAVAEFETKYGKGGRADFIRRHILKNFHAFELMMAPYAVGHLKMSFFLEELGHRLADDERVPFYLTNTLDNEELEQSRLPGFSALAEESRLAGLVKRQTPVLVILGNPPYSGHSSNVGEWIRGLIETYKQVDGKPLGERNPKWLQDDYVKFLRFAQWKIEQAGCGVVGMITNHSYLDNPTFRGMRQSLMRTFDDICILDLHGNSLKKETCPDGSPDKNVFDIRQGVAIAFFVKRRPARAGGGADAKAEAAVRHAELHGTREAKCAWLDAHDAAGTRWRKLEPRSGSYLFIRRDETSMRRYERYPSMPAIFPVNSVGIVTARDSLTIHWKPEDVWSTVTVFSKMEPELARRGYGLGKDALDWQVTLAQRDILDSGPARDRVTPVLYRPFDMRHTYYTGRTRGFICRPRAEVMRHMLAGENLALCVGRQGQVVGAGEWSLCFCSNMIEDLNLFYRGGNVNFPLYLYPEPGQPKKDKAGVGRYVAMMLFETKERYGARRPNLDAAVVDALSAAYGKAPAPEDIFRYVYAVLYAPAYRKKYAEFLKSDFPRIPFTADAKLFKRLATLGAKMISLHLLQSPELDPPACRFEGEGDGRVGKDRKAGLRYDTEGARVYVNGAQHFAPVPEAVWTYQVGGYQVCEKWLKDRKGRRLEVEDIRAYCRIVTALCRTVELQYEIDAVYPDAEKQTVSVSL
ncbi:MAG: N-6 DNA methylase [Kiritimatiellae bacterium]|nr:N-6 DNA methylase [Kiritimatiellia bacterium]